MEEFVTRSDILLTYQLDSIDSLKAYLGMIVRIKHGMTLI